MNRCLLLLLASTLLVAHARAQGCGTTVYDTGGAGGQYGNNQNLTWTYCPPAGQVITITFTAFNTEAGFDYLSVHNGATNAAPQLGLFTGTALPPSITGTVPGGCITLWFTSDASVPAAGWIANITCATPPPPPAVCGTTVYDPGGAAGNYANNVNYTVTYCPSVPGQVVTMTFTQFNTEANFDFVTIYNGPSAASPTLGTYSGTGIPGPFTSTHPGGCLTLVFTSDGSVPYSGWAANISCATPPPPPSGDCIYVLSLNDSFGDGWGTSFVGVSINGGPYTNYTVGTFSNTILFGVNIGDLVVLNYNASGTFQGENSFSLGMQGAGGLYSSPAPPTAGIVYAATVDCVPPPSPPEDCTGALTVCDNQAITNNPGNTGNVVDLNTGNMGCLSNAERQGTWYVFSPSSPGNVAFTIDPLDPLDDYDFAIWGPYPPGTTTGSICPPPGVPLRCSYAAPSGATGLNYTATDNSETALGDKWVNDIAVSADQVYLMYISNWSQSSTGFNLSWNLQNGASLDCTVLPVELTDFQARAVAEDVLVEWTTATETASDHFEVERSQDGAHFEHIGTLPGAGHSTHLLHYSFVDQDPQLGTNYYRLRQVDTDGSTEHSPVRSVLMQGAGAVLRLAPNPGSGQVELLFPLLEPGALFTLLDATGREVMRLPLNAQRSTMDVSHLPSGLYGYRVLSATGGALGQGIWVRE